jgi:hypothetical protein
MLLLDYSILTADDVIFYNIWLFILFKILILTLKYICYILFFSNKTHYNKIYFSKDILNKMND